MSMEDTPWGAEQVILSTALEISGGTTDIGVRKLQIDGDEMTDVHRHRHKHELLVVDEGLVEVQVGDDLHELGAGDTQVIEAGTPHQLQNLESSVAHLTEIGIPFDPDDHEVIQDPYR